MKLRKLNNEEVIKNMLELAFYLIDDDETNDEIEVNFHNIVMRFSLEVNVNDNKWFN